MRGRYWESGQCGGLGCRESHHVNPVSKHRQEFVNHQRRAVDKGDDQLVGVEGPPQRPGGGPALERKDGELFLGW